MVTSKANPKAIKETEEWQTVRRHRHYPDGWKEPQINPAPTTKTYTPYRPTYTQAVSNRSSPNPSPATSPRAATTPPIPQNTTTNKPQPPLHPLSRPRSSPTPYYTSPHSPTPLCFLPSTKFTEWRGRCFRCCRRGHTFASCRNPLRCGKCWKQGHPGSRCLKNPKPVPPPAQPNPTTVQGSEPLFDELLTGPYPYAAPVITNRPEERLCFVDRDDDYFREVDMLHRRRIVIGTEGLEFDLGIDKAAELVASSKLVEKKEVSVGILTKGRYLVLLPEGLVPATVAAALPASAWAMGVTYQTWSPLEDGEYSNMDYKVVVNLIGVPPPLRREKEIIRAVSTFGVYLGTIDSENPANLANWTVVCATHDLADIPRRVKMVAGGIKFFVPVVPIKWSSSPVYKEDERPKPATIFPPLNLLPPTPQTEEEEEPTQDTFPMSRTTVESLCRGHQLNTLPEEVRRFLTQKGPSIATATEEEEVVSLGSLGLHAQYTQTVHVTASENPTVSATGSPRSGHEAGQSDSGDVLALTTVNNPPQKIATTQQRGDRLESEPSLGPLSPIRASRTLPLVGAEQDRASCLFTPTSTDKSRISHKQQDGGPLAQHKRKHGATASPSPAQKQLINDRPVEILRRPASSQLFPEMEGTVPKKPNAELQADGFYKIHVGYSACVDLAEICGVKPKEVVRSVEEDNLERMEAHLQAGTAGPSERPGDRA